MSMATEIRLLLILGILALSVAALAVVGVTHWLTGRVARGREWLAAARPRGIRLDYEPQRLQRELEARSARWRMLL